MRSDVRRVACSITASDGQRPPGKMYCWIQLAPRRWRSYAASRNVIDWRLSLPPGRSARSQASKNGARYPAAKLAGWGHREPAPACAALQDVLARCQAGPLRHDPVLVPLGIRQRLVGRGEDGARVRHGLVEEEPVEVVAEVVVRRDVAAALPARVATRPVGQGPEQLG